MRILITAPFLSPTQNVSGVSTVVQGIIEYNKIHHYQHYVLGRQDQPTSRFVWLKNIIRQIIFFPFFIRKHKIDLVHQNLPFDPKGLVREFIINVWCRIYQVPVVLHIHGGAFLMTGTSNAFYRLLSRSLFKYSNQILVLSEIEREALQIKHHCNSSQVLPNSIDVSYYQGEPRQLPDKKPTLLFMGRIHESKGIEDIIEAFRLLKTKLDFRFILCGDGNLKDYFVTSCIEILGNDFEYPGVVSGAVKINIIHTSDLFLLPSRYGEGMPMALLETMAAGVVPVVTNDASMKIVVQHEINGIQVEKKNPIDLYEKLEFILTNPTLYSKLSINATKTIKSKYDIPNYINKLNDLYRIAMNN